LGKIKILHPPKLLISYDYAPCHINLLTYFEVKNHKISGQLGDKGSRGLMGYDGLPGRPGTPGQAGE